MKCTKCNSNVPVGNKICPFCGKRLKPSALELIEQKPVTNRAKAKQAYKNTSLDLNPNSTNTRKIVEDKKLDYNGLEAWFKMDSQEKSELVDPPKKESADKGEALFSNNDYFGTETNDTNEPERSSGDESIMPGLVPAHEDYGTERGVDIEIGHDTVEDNSNSADVAAFEPPKDEESSDLFSDEKPHKISDMFAKNEVAPPPGNINSTGGLYGPANQTKQQSNNGWEKPEYSEYNEPQPAKTTTVRELRREIVHEKGKPSNATVGFMVVIFSLFLMGKGGIFLLNTLGIFREELFNIIIWPWINLVESGVFFIVIWLVAIVTRPTSLKVLALLFALGATIVYGYYTYTNLYLNSGLF